MKLEALNGALKRALPAVSRTAVIPALTLIWFKKDQILAYDGGLGIKFDFDSGLDLGVPGHTLSKLLATTPLEEVELSQDKDALSVKLGRSTSKLAVMPAESFMWPFPETAPKGSKPIKFDENVIEGLRKALLVKASPVTRVEHNGIMLQVVPDGIELYATDSASLVRVTVAVDRLGSKPKGTDPVLLPRAFVEQLVSEAASGADFYALEDCLFAEYEKGSLYSNMLDLSAAERLDELFEKFTDHFPKEGVTLPPGLKGALERAEILAGRNEPFVTLKAKGKQLKLTATYPLGSLDEDFELDEKHETATLIVYAPKLVRGLVHAETFTFDEKAILLEGGGDFAYLLAAKG